jgi:hypothetical protein
MFTNEATAGEFQDDPEGFLPGGCEAEDVDAVLPEVAARTGLDFSNVASSGGGASAASHLSQVQQTIYQQNAYIYAEEGSQVTNIQGDDNAVAQQQVDVDVDFGQGETEPPTETGEQPGGEEAPPPPPPPGTEGAGANPNTNVLWGDYFQTIPPGGAGTPEPPDGPAGWQQTAEGAEGRFGVGFDPVESRGEQAPDDDGDPPGGIEEMGDEPAATLLLPYFEVDLDEEGPDGITGPQGAEDGPTTLFSINNAAEAEAEPAEPLYEDAEPAPPAPEPPAEDPAAGMEGMEGV